MRYIFIYFILLLGYTYIYVGLSYILGGGLIVAPAGGQSISGAITGQAGQG